MYRGEHGLAWQNHWPPPGVAVGSSFEILTNTGFAARNGTFNGLDEGADFSQGGYQFQITYQGGTGGSSVVLTRLA